MSDLIHMIVQGTDLSEHEAKTFLQLLTDHVRGSDQDLGADPASDTAELSGIAAELRGLRDDLRKELDGVPARIEEALEELTKKLDALDKATDKRLDAHDRALKALKGKPAPNAPAPETGAAERTDQGGAPSPAS